MPDVLPEPKLLVDLGRMSLKLWDGNVRVLGAAMFRAGDFAGAKKAFDQKPSRPSI